MSLRKRGGPVRPRTARWHPAGLRRCGMREPGSSFGNLLPQGEERKSFLLVEELTREYINTRIYDLHSNFRKSVRQLVGRVRDDQTDLSLRF